MTNTQNFRPNALKHIFEGEINRSGSAMGYHYEMILDTPGTVIDGTISATNSSGVYEAKVKVNGVLKSGNGGTSTFFPKDMTPQGVVNAINEAYNNKTYVQGNIYRGPSNSGLKIEMFINEILSFS